MQKCPACQKDLPTATASCPSCGAPQVQADPYTTAAQPPAGLEPTPVFIPVGETRFAPGQVLAGRFCIVSRLGKGGMGEVYRADDLRLGQSVALKFLSPAWINDPQRLAYLHEEVRVTRQISHPNVCRVYDIEESDGQMFLTMEFIDGEDLSSLLRRIGRLPPDKGIEIARQLCLGLAAAHQLGVIHRDLKPANIMVDGRGHVRITDFGLARVAEQITGTDAHAGTPAYMAPEQLAGTKITIRTDVYALGLVLYEIFTGQKAFQASSPHELRKLKESSTPSTPSSHVSDLDTAVVQVILRCLERDASKRPPSALAVAAALPGGDPLAAALAAGETPSPEIVAAAGDSDAWSPRHALACLVGTLVALVVCVLLYDKASVVGRVGVPESTGFLRGKAREILKKAGFPEGKDNAVGFEHDLGLLREINENDRSANRWDRLEQPRLAGIYFWYRQAPTYLVAELFYPHPGTLETDRITLIEPAPVMPGMVHVKLDLRGRLLELHWVPPDKPPGLCDWKAFFEAAGLDFDDFRADSPREVPPNFADQRLAWVEKSAREVELPLRIEAASFEGRPVYFHLIVGDPTLQETHTGGQVVMQKNKEWVQAILFTGILLAAVLLAPRNWSQGRSDRKGAIRLAFGSFVIFMIGWLVETHHVPSDDELRLLVQGLACALYWAGLLGLSYIALEPYVRQFFPEALITWTRILAGQWRDPRVGRDLLVGTLCGVLIQILDQVGRTVPAYFGAITPFPYFDWWIPNSYVDGYWIGSFCLNLIRSFRLVFFYVLLLFVLLRVSIKRPIPTAILYILTSATLFIGNYGSLNEPSWHWVFALLIGIILWFLAIRVGTLALIAASFVRSCLCFPLTADLMSWRAHSGMLAVGAVLFLAGYGFHMSLAGRPWFRDELSK